MQAKIDGSFSYCNFEDGNAIAEIGVKFRLESGDSTTNFMMCMDIYGEEAFLQFVRCALHDSEDNVIGSDPSGDMSDCRPQFRIEGDDLTVGIADPHAEDCLTTTFALYEGEGARLREQLAGVLEHLKTRAAGMNEAEKLLAALSRYDSREEAEAARTKLFKATGRLSLTDSELNEQLASQGFELA